MLTHSMFQLLFKVHNCANPTNLFSSPLTQNHKIANCFCLKVLSLTILKSKRWKQLVSSFCGSLRKVFILSKVKEEMISGKRKDLLKQPGCFVSREIFLIIIFSERMPKKINEMSRAELLNLKTFDVRPTN